MPLLKSDNFDSYSSVADMNAAGLIVTATSGVSTATRTGTGKCAVTPVSGVGQYITIHFSHAVGENLLFKCWFKANWAVGAPIFRLLYDQNNFNATQYNIQGSGSIGGVRTLELRRGSTLQATGTQQINDFVWRHFELNIFISQTVGFVEAKLDGIVDCAVYNANTQAYSGNSAIQGIVIYGGSTNAQVMVDDVYIYDHSANDDFNYLMCLH